MLIKPSAFLFSQVMYFTAIFPYIVLIIFFGRAITLKGADEGLLHMITPRVSWERIGRGDMREKKRVLMRSPDEERLVDISVTVIL